MKIYPIIIFALILIAIIILLIPTQPDTITVSRIIDGDTIELSTGERVRLLNIDTPEKGQPFFKEASDFLASLVEGKAVQLKADIEDKDKYGRLLRHIFVNGMNINLEMVKSGYASVLIIEPNKKYSAEFLEAELQAKEAGIGIWSLTGINLCISIFDFKYNAPGNDNENLNGEYVTFRNKCAEPVNMTDWVLADSRKNKYVFKVAVGPKEKITLHTGSGTDNSTDLFWGRSMAVWNNDGDKLVLIDRDGKVVLEYEY